MKALRWRTTPILVWAASSLAPTPPQHRLRPSGWTPEALSNHAAPFGGRNDSGLGTEYGPEGLAAYLSYKSFYHR
jgi:hypothetical protein